MGFVLALGVASLPPLPSFLLGLALFSSLFLLLPLLLVFLSQGVEVAVDGLRAMPSQNGLSPGLFPFVGELFLFVIMSWGEAVCLQAHLVLVCLYQAHKTEVMWVIGNERA